MAEPHHDSIREQTRQQLLSSFGGWSGTIVAAIPPIVFVAVNAGRGLRAGIIAAVAAGVIVAIYRLIRRQPVQQAVMGLFSVVVAAAIAGRTGQARGFFLLGIAAAVVYAVVFAISMLMRRPLVGVFWEYLEPSPLAQGTRWHQVRILRRAYDLASGAALLMFAARGAVQLRLFQDNRTGWLAATKLIMGFPLYIVVVAFGFWIVRRARAQLEPIDDEPADGPDSEDPAGTASMRDGSVRSGRTDAAPDGRLGLGQGDE
ncbi:MAG: hypothetical protein JWN95_3426 [Frankiales bacterium]|nr:hypothetical protein [Frankiales bacterium]